MSKQPDIIAGLDAVKPGSKTHTAGQNGDAELLDTLAEMPRFEYELKRVAIAKELGIRTFALDKEVEKLRVENSENPPSLVEELEPWPGDVDITEVLQEIRDALKRYVIHPDGADVALPLWIAGTYVHRDLYVFPRLSITSPEKRCGKTTLVSFLSGVVSRALPASNVSTAVVYRVIQKCAPTLLIDEADTFVSENNELRGIVNSGHTKPLAFVLRSQGDDHEPARFSTWSPMVLASIKDVGDTIIDRSVTIQLRRKMPGESIERLPVDFPELSKDLRRKLVRWGGGMGRVIASHDPKLPESNNDRALDNWRPLLAIAEKAGGNWPALALKAFQDLSIDGDDATGPEILSDIRRIFEDESLEWIYSTELAEKLNALEEAPWSHWSRGSGINANNIARKLKPFGIRSQDIRDGEDVRKGYRASKLKDAFKRYLPDIPQI